MKSFSKKSIIRSRLNTVVPPLMYEIRHKWCEKLGRNTVQPWTLN